MTNANLITILDEKEAIEKLNETERDYKWFIKNEKELRRKYQNKFVAILNEEVIASSDKVEDLVRELKKKKLEDVIIEFIEPENVIIVY
jgi:hypothetical protein